MKKAQETVKTDEKKTRTRTRRAVPKVKPEAPKTAEKRTYTPDEMKQLQATAALLGTTVEALMKLQR